MWIVCAICCANDTLAELGMKYRIIALIVALALPVWLNAQELAAADTALPQFNAENAEANSGEFRTLDEEVQDLKKLAVG